MRRGRRFGPVEAPEFKGGQGGQGGHIGAGPRARPQVEGA